MLSCPDGPCLLQDFYLALMRRQLVKFWQRPANVGPVGSDLTGSQIWLMQLSAAQFLQVAYGAVYSLHKTTTRAHVQKVAQRELRVASAEVLAEMRFDLPATYAFHKQRSADIAVDLWRFALS